MSKYAKSYSAVISDKIVENRSTTIEHEFPDKSTYLGEWLGHKRHGKGIHKRPDGDVYEGNYIDDEQSG